MALAGPVQCYRQALNMIFGAEKLLSILGKDAFLSNLGKKIIGTIFRKMLTFSILLDTLKRWPVCILLEGAPDFRDRVPTAWIGIWISISISKREVREVEMLVYNELLVDTGTEI